MMDTCCFPLFPTRFFLLSGMLMMSVINVEAHFFFTLLSDGKHNMMCTYGIIVTSYGL